MTDSPPQATAQGYDTVDVTAAIRSQGSNHTPTPNATNTTTTTVTTGGDTAVLAVQGWSWAGGAPSGHRGGHTVQGGVMLLLTLRFADGSTQTVATKAADPTADPAAGQSHLAPEPRWMAFNATPAFNPGGGIGGMYYQPAENVRPRLSMPCHTGSGYPGRHAQRTDTPAPRHPNTVLLCVGPPLPIPSRSRPRPSTSHQITDHRARSHPLPPSLIASEPNHRLH